MTTAEMTRKERLELWKKEKAAQGLGSSIVRHSSTATGSLESSKSQATTAARSVASSKSVAGIDENRERQAGKARVGPGTPINKLKQRVAGARIAKQTASLPLSAPVAAAAAAAPAPARGPVKRPMGVLQPRVNTGGKLSALRNPAHMQKLSQFLKSQIAESEVLVAVSGPAAASTLLRELLDSKDTAAVGELALFWAARARIEEDAGRYDAARSLLSEGEAFLSVSTQQRVLEKVVAAFEERMEAQDSSAVDRLLDARDNAPAMAPDAAAAAGNNSSPPSMEAPADAYRYNVDASFDAGSGDGSGESSGSTTMARTSKALRFSSSPKIIVRGESGMGSDNAENEHKENPAGDAAGGAEIDLAAYLVPEADVAPPQPTSLLPAAAAAPVTVSAVVAGISPAKPGEEVLAQEEDGKEAMLPPPARTGRKRKGTPHPARSSKRRSGGSSPFPAQMGGTMTQQHQGADAGSEGREETGSFMLLLKAGKAAAAVGEGASGELELTPVRRSRRVAANRSGGTGPTPSPMRRELEAMLT